MYIGKGNIPMDEKEVEQYRFHPAWKAALRYIKEKICEEKSPEDLDTYMPYVSGWARGQSTCLDVIDTELNKTEGV